MYMNKLSKSLITVIVIVLIFSTGISNLVKAILVEYDLAETKKYLITISVTGICCGLLAFFVMKLIKLIYPKWFKSMIDELNKVNK